MLSSGSLWKYQLIRKSGRKMRWLDQKFEWGKIDKIDALKEYPWEKTISDQGGVIGIRFPFLPEITKIMTEYM